MRYILDKLNGKGINDLFSNREKANQELRKSGFRPANFKKNLRRGNSFTKSIRNRFVPGSLSVFQHPSGVLAYAGILRGTKFFCVRIIGSNECRTGENCENALPQKASAHNIGQYDTRYCTTEKGISDFSYDTKACAIKKLQRSGFRPANFKKNLRRGNSFTKSIRNRFVPGSLSIFQHPNGMLAYVGTNRDTYTCWVRLVSAKEISEGKEDCTLFVHFDHKVGESNYRFKNPMTALDMLIKKGFVATCSESSDCFVRFVRSNYLVGQHIELAGPEETAAFIGFGTSGVKELWVRIVGRNEIDYWSRHRAS